MGKPIYLYHVNYQRYEKELCALEISVLFEKEFKQKVFLSTKKINPLVSPYIKKRLEILHKSSSFGYICELLERNRIVIQDFSVTYAPFYKNDPYEKKGRKFSKELGLRIMGFPSFKNPTIVYGITYYEGYWYFGVLNSNDTTWKEHNNKPYNYSSALGINLAKALVNIVTKGNLKAQIIDPCCGVGTVLLAAEYSGYSIEGWEIKEKVAENARQNLEFFGYRSKVTTGDIQEITKHYDCAIVDLPYGNFSHITEELQKVIIQNALRISSRVALVVSGDIQEFLLQQEVQMIEMCKVRKRDKGDFHRYIYICENFK